MEDCWDSNAVKALPEALTRHLSSAVDISSSQAVIKELVDNALDAQATSIAIEIDADTTSSIQVRDNGTGIASESRPLIARRHCTTKIRGFDDLKRVGGSTLGFRGVALASIAAMSGALQVTTRTEREDVATKLHIDAKGEVEKDERASAGVGTTVRISGYLVRLPVREKVARQCAIKTLAELKSLLQAYALARPTIRLSLRVLKAKSTRGDFIHAPRPGASLEEAVLTAIGRDVSSQCAWSIWEDGCYRIRACLPRRDAVPAKARSAGQYIAIDARPISVAKGVGKEIQRAIKDRLKLLDLMSQAVGKVFFCLNIDCPSESYDVNVEPAKDDLLFHDPTVLLDALTSLLDTVYPRVIVAPENLPADELLLDVPDALPSSSTLSEAPSESLGTSSSGQGQLSRNHSSLPTSVMPGGFSDDVGCASDRCDKPGTVVAAVLPPMADRDESETECRQDISISNPWTIARMNASTRPRKLATFQTQQPSPPSSDPVMELAPFDPFSSRSGSHSRTFTFSDVSRKPKKSSKSEHRTLNDLLRTEVFGGNRTVRSRVPRQGLVHALDSVSEPQLPLTRWSGNSDSHTLRTILPAPEAVAYEDVIAAPPGMSDQPRRGLRQSRLNFGTSKRRLGAVNAGLSLPGFAGASQDEPSATRPAFEEFQHPNLGSSNQCYSESGSRTEGGQRASQHFYRSVEDQCIRRGGGTSPIPYNFTNAGSASVDCAPPIISAVLPLESIAEESDMQNVVHSLHMPLNDVSRLVESYGAVSNVEAPFIANASEAEIQNWTMRLAASLEEDQPGKIVVSNLFSYLSDAVKMPTYIA